MKTKPEGSIWTDKQWQAVVQDNNNILVSAGAGSGKTAVLTERILEKLKSGVDISTLVVLTFTNAAAKEMKQRVQMKVQDEITKTNNSFLIEQQDKIEMAQITTFDSYSMFLLQKYYYKLGISKNIKILDKLFVAQKKQKIINQIFESYFIAKDERFIKLVDHYTAVSDFDLKNKIIKMHASYSQTMHKKSISEIYNDDFFQTALSHYVQELHDKASIITDNLEALKSINKDGVLDSYIEKLYHKYQFIISAESYNDFARAIIDVESETVRKPVKNKLGDDADKIDKLNKEIADAYKKLKADVIYQSENDLKELFYSNQDIIAIVEKIIIDFDMQLKAFKQEINSYEYIDINFLVIQLLENNEDVRNELSNGISEILVDEYQDTNDIQEYCLSLLSNGKNIYAVGDVKQAIYGFRNANPDNFKQKYLNYQNGNNGILIDLNKNFRSRNEVLDNINIIFEKIFDENIGGVAYDDMQKLSFGNKSYLKHNPTHNNNMKIYTYSSKALKEEAIDSKNFEYEHIAKDIVSKIENKFQVMGKDGLRDCKLSDFAILTETKSNHKLLLEILENHKLNVQVSDFNEPFISSSEVLLIKNALKIIISMNDYHYGYEFLVFATMAVMRSFIFTVDDDLIDGIIKKLKILMEQQNFNKQNYLELFESTQYYNKLSKLLKVNYDEISVYESTLEILCALEVIDNIYNLDSISSGENNIYTLLQKSQMIDSSFLRLKDFVDYLDNFDLEVKKEKSKISLDVDFEIKSEGDFEAINIMSIHKSKGLEFPICYFPNFSVKFHKSFEKESFVYDKDYGFVIKGINNKGNLADTLLIKSYKMHENKKFISEKLRLLYVALTRAKEQMIFYLNDDDQDEVINDIVDSKKRAKYSKLEDVFNSISNIIGSYKEEMDINSYKEAETYQNNVTINNTAKSSSVEYLDFKYQPQIVESVRASMSINEVLDNQTKKNIAYGNELHEHLEYIDFSQLDDEISKADEKIKKVLINIKEIVSDSNKSDFYSEYQFQYEQNGSLITGIIDLLIETDDKFIVVDYKLNDIHKKEYEKQLKTYYDYLNTISDKEIKLYLLSILSSEVKQVDISN